MGKRCVFIIITFFLFLKIGSAHEITMEKDVSLYNDVTVKEMVLDRVFMINVDLNVPQYCEDSKVQGTFKFLGLILFLAKIFVPILIIGMGCMDFGNAIVSGKDDEIKKRIPILIKRFIAGVIIFFIPTIINFLFSQISSYNESIDKYCKCWTCIFDPNHCGTCNRE